MMTPGHILEILYWLSIEGRILHIYRYYLILTRKIARELE